MDKYSVVVSLKNDKVLLKGKARENDEVSMDYFPPVGDGMGYTGLELLLMSFTGCSSTSVVYLLRKMGKNIISFEADASGIFNDKTPKAFREIIINYKIKSNDITSGDVLKAVKLSEESVCPVWSMLRGNVVITPLFELSV